MKKKISVKQFDIEYFKKFEINNTNRILGGTACTIDNCTYSADSNTPGSTSGSNQAGGSDDGGGTVDETPRPAQTTVAP